MRTYDGCAARDAIMAGSQFRDHLIDLFLVDS